MSENYGKLENTRNAICEYIIRHSVVIWQEKPGDQPYIGSGTCIEIDGRYFIATAAHNFEDIPHGGKVTLISALSD